MTTKPGNGGFVAADSRSRLRIPPTLLTQASSTSPTEPVGFIYDDRIEKLEREISNLKQIIQAIQENFQAAPKTIELRDLTPKQAKKEIEAYFKAHDGEVISAVDLQKELGIEIELACKICEDLEREGKVRGA